MKIWQVPALALFVVSGAMASPLSGSFQNINPSSGLDANYAFAKVSHNVYVFHHFGVEVC